MSTETTVVSEWNSLLRFLQDNAFRMVLVEGSRGVGKSTFINKLQECTSFEYYKTWGRNQRNERHKLGESGLDITQGTYFILDFISQVCPFGPVISDRGNLSALVYQYANYYEAHELHTYYASLMLRSKSVLLVLDAPVDMVLARRVGRKEDDEQRLYIWPPESAKAIVEKDCRMYDAAVRKMLNAGMKLCATFELDGIECCCYIHKDLLLTREESHDADEDT